VLTAAAVTLGVPETAGAALTFRDCASDRCARLSVRLDHGGVVPGRVSLAVRSYGFRPGRRVALLLSGAAGAFTPDPFEWHEPLSRHALVTFDQRGTGKGALRCRDLEAATVTDAGREAAACAALLGERRRFYRASDTVEDIELLRAALGVERLTIVGPGYGSYLAQRYALRYPERVERLILTSVVDAAGVDPLLLDSVMAARRVLDDLCRGSACNGFTRDPAGDTHRLVARLAASPLRGPIVGPTGRRRVASLSRQELLFTLLAGDDNPITRSDYPAAVSSALEGDSASLLRLKRRSTWAAAPRQPRNLSAATATAAACEEVRFPWSWQATPAERAEAAYRAESEMAPALAAPFDPGTLVRSELMRLCGRWPTASASPPVEPGPMPDVPVLLLADATRIGRPVETAMRTAARFPRAKLLATSAAFPALDECGVRAIQRFVRGERVQDRCPREGPAIPAAAPVPTSLRDLAPFPGVPGRRGRLVTAFAVTFGDLIDDFFARFLSNPNALLSGGKIGGGGLRGGSFFAKEEVLRLRRYEFVPGVRLSGQWRGGGDAASAGPLRIDGPGRLDGIFRLRDTDQDLVLRLRGRIAGRRVKVRVHVPSRLVATVEEEGGFGRAAALPWLP
jgi:pimeloyl-ACP methyl ester carboxylesterase